MHGRQVLNVGVIADPDGGHVGADNGVVPDGRVAPDGDVAEHDGTGRDECGGMDHVP